MYIRPRGFYLSLFSVPLLFFSVVSAEYSPSGRWWFYSFLNCSLRSLTCSHLVTTELMTNLCFISFLFFFSCAFSSRRASRSGKVPLSNSGSSGAAATAGPSGASAAGVNNPSTSAAVGAMDGGGTSGGSSSSTSSSSSSAAQTLASGSHAPATSSSSSSSASSVPVGPGSTQFHLIGFFPLFLC